MMTSKMEKEVSWENSQARLVQSEGKVLMSKFSQEDRVVYGEIKGQIHPTRKFGDTRGRRRWKSLTQTDTNDQRKGLCKEIAEAVLEKYGVEENKRSLRRQR